MQSHAHIKVGITDINGVLRSKYLHQDKFTKVLKKGLPFCDVIMGSDINDDLIDNLHFTGWQSGYPDKPLHIIEESERHLPFENNRLFYLSEFKDYEHAFCPRSALKKLTINAANQKLHFTAGMEFEFTLFKETPESAKEKGYQNLSSATPGQCGYSMLRTSELHAFHDELLETTSKMRLPLEGLHTEIGPGVIEAALQKAPILEAADRAALFKTVTKLIARRHGLMACFMAKWDKNQQGQSGHIHFSIQDENQKGLFFDESKDSQLSDTMNYVLSGLQKNAPELLLLSTPFPNSFSRLVPGFWAPTQASIGFDNRTTAIRALLGNEASQRIEVRIAGADANPYLAMSSIVLSSLDAIAKKNNNPIITKGNAYQESLPLEYQLPAHMPAAIDALNQSSLARNYLGEHFIDDYCQVKQHEWQLSQAAITDWALNRYFELG